MKHMFATVVVVFAIAGCATGQGVATGAATSPSQLSTPTASPPGPTPSPSKSPAPSAALFPDGPLPAGSHSIQPFVGSGWLCMGQAGCTESAEDDSIRITLTVPDGWAGFEIGIVPSVERSTPPGGAALLFMRGGWLWSELCGDSGPDIPTGTTVDEFVTALVDHPDLDVTSPVDVTLGGFAGQYLELRAPGNLTPSGCGYFVWEPGIYAQGPNALWRIWVLDVDGVRVVVRSDSFPGTSPQVQAQLQSIVDSIQIEP